MRAPRILIADDSATVRAVVRKQLVEHGYEVAEAVDGEDAMARATEGSLDVILLDLQMPKLDGLGVLSRLRAETGLRGVPVVILSGRTEVDQVVAALQAGAHDYLTKPFEPSELAARVAAATRTKRALDELLTRNSELEAFATRASHDLKSPLAIIKGMAEVVQGGPGIAPDQRDDLLRRIVSAAGRAARMVDDLLLLARYSSPVGVEPTLEDPERIVRDAVAGCALDRADVTIGGDWAPIALEPADLAAAVRNLCENAGHYGRSVDGVLRLSITATRDARYLAVDVADRGPGVPPNEKAAVFEPFWRSSGSLSINPASTGIGLALVWRSIQRVGGSVELLDTEPHGARFRLWLPRATNE